MNRTLTGVLLGCAAISAPVFAQDSVSKVGALPGDAVDVYTASEQCNDYVLDLASFRGSWNTRFTIGPITKGSKSCDPAFYNNLLSGHAISSNRLDNVSFARNSYSVWNGPGFGINNDPALNDPGTPVNTDNATGSQFSVAFTEFGGESNNIVGAVVNYDPSDPGRLFVSRIAGATNGDNCACNLAQIGFGGVDASGNVVFRADDFGTGSCAGFAPLVGNNYFCVDLLGRNCNVLNVISNAGGSDAPATGWPVMNSGDTHNTPTVVPEAFAGAPFYIGSNFNTEYVRGTCDGQPNSDQTHLDPCNDDQRGNMSYTQYRFPNILGSSDLGTGALIGRVNGINHSMNIYGIGAGGAVTGTLCCDLPGVVRDNATGFQNTDLGPGTNIFGHHQSQTAFRGGNGQIAIGQDIDGNLLGAGVVYYPDEIGSDNPLNYVAVCRVDPVSGAESWTMAGYNNGTSAGTGNPADFMSKPIYDGDPSRPTTSVIGQMVPLLAVTGGAPSGPSVSAPMIDAAGNVWFISAVELAKIDEMGNPFSDFDSALLRAVYDPNTFSYNLELVVELGNVFPGLNSGTPYQIQFMGIADNNSVSSGTAFSGNMLQDTHSSALPGQNLCPRDPKTFGGVVINADITYDTSGDGTFDDAVDESYQSLLYIGTDDDPCELDLELNPTSAAAGQAFEFTGTFGNPGDGVLLVLTGINGAPVFNPILVGAFGSDCTYNFLGVAPAGFSGIVADFSIFGITPCGVADQSNTVSLTFL